MTEPDVTLTDYGLTVLCSWFAWSLRRRKSAPSISRTLWTVLFASIGAAAFTGGTVHGFFLDKSTLGHRLLWPATMLAIGVTAACAWVLTGLLFSGTAKIKSWILFALATFAVYAAAVFFYSQSFLIVILNYLPAMLALLVVSLQRYLRSGAKSHRFVVTGLLLSFLAAFIQQAGLGLHPAYFNHNATYHLVQAFGLWFLFKGARDSL